MSVLPLDQVDEQEWHERRAPVDLNGREDLFIQLIEELVERAPLKGDKYQRTMRRYVRRGLPWLSKSQVITAYEELCDQDRMEYRPEVVTEIGRAHV